MKLHDIARGAVGMVNPNIKGMWYKSIGSKEGYGAIKTPQYDDPIEVELQVQSAAGQYLTHTDFINIQGEKKVVYADHQVFGIDRVRGLNGDLLEFDGRKWLVVQRLEGWERSEWCKVLVTAQLDQPEDEESIINYER